MKPIEDEYTTLKELADNDLLSVRAINICNKYKLLTLSQILNFYKKHGSFLKLHNCGKRTEQELLAFCANHKELKLNIEVKDNENTLDIIHELNPLKKSTLNRHVEYLISNLSVRAQNGIKKIAPSGTIKELIEVIYENKFYFKKLRHVGTKTIEELKLFKIQISLFLIQLRTLHNDELGKEYAKLIVKTTFKDLTNNFEFEFDRAFDPSGKIKLFRFLSFIIESDQLFNRNEKRIFYSIYSTLNGAEESLENIAQELQLSRERIRQIKSSLQENIHNYFNFISNFNNEDFVNYDIETMSSFKLIDDSFCEKLNRNEDVKFNTIFFSIIFGLFLNKSHSVLGDDEKINSKKRTARCKGFKCCYLISRNLFDIFEFELLVENINSQLNERITETYSLYFEGFLLQFINKESKHLLKEIIPICEIIILNEFDLVVNVEGYLVFERNTRKTISKYIVEILETKGSKMKVEDVCTAINEKYPDLKTTEQSIRTSFQKDKEFFIFFGRSSTYGLKKWEFEQDDVKGGTIRDIVEEYLSNTNSPKHISEILKYVQKYRETNEKSVMSNIAAEERNRFQFFNGDFIGLASRKYGPETLNYKRVVGSHFIKRMLTKFNGLDLEQLIHFYVNRYGYASVQVRHLMEKKVIDGYIKITQDNKIKV